MKKKELTNRIQEGFFELAPDMFDKIMEATENPVRNEELNISDTKKIHSFYHSSQFRMLRRVAIFIFVIGLGLGFGIFSSKEDESAYVLALDVNPSIQMELNNDYFVQKIVGLNADGENIIKKLTWEKNSSLEQTVGTITDKLVSEGYLRKDSGILITLIRKDESQDCEELKNILNQELEKDTIKCGISGIKVAFQTVETKTKQTGKEILKEHMMKEYHMEHDKIDDMNIRDMIDYAECEKTGAQILENVVTSNNRKSVQETASPKSSVRKEHEEKKEQTASQENKKTMASATPSSSQNATVEDSKSKQEVKDDKNSQTDKKEQTKQPEKDTKSTQEQESKTDNNNNQGSWANQEDKNNQEKWLQPDNKTQQGMWTEPDSKNYQEKWSQPDNKTQQGKWSQPDSKNYQEKWQTPNNRNNPAIWPKAYSSPTPAPQINRWGMDQAYDRGWDDYSQAKSRSKG